MKRFLFITVTLLFVGAAGYAILREKDPVPPEYVHAERGDIVREVSVTGTVVADSSAQLSFRTAGIVDSVLVRVGDRVMREQELARLSRDEIEAELLRARADREVEHINLAALRRGLREEEVQVSRVKVENAERSLEDTEHALVDTLKDAYTKGNDAVRHRADQMYSGATGSSPQLRFITSHVLKTNLENQRFVLQGVLEEWHAFTQSVPFSEDILEDAALVRENVEQIKMFFEMLAEAVNRLESSSSLSQTTIDAWTSDVVTAQANLNVVLANITAGTQTVRSARSALTLAKNELALKEAGATEEDIAAAEARIARAEAAIQQLEVRLADTILRSPLNGTVVERNIEPGETVSPGGRALFVVQSSGSLKIEARIPEADITQIALGDTARVTLDAYGDEVPFRATVASIEPSASTIEGVPTYKTTLFFKPFDHAIRPGMTANVDILTDTQKDVIFIPQRAVMRENGTEHVRIIVGNGEFENVAKVPVETGLRGSNGQIEIVSGISEGDRVVVFMPE